MTAKTMDGRALRGVVWRQMRMGDHVGQPLAEWAYSTDEEPAGIPRSQLASLPASTQKHVAMYWLNANFEPLEYGNEAQTFQLDGPPGSGFDHGILAGPFVVKPSPVISARGTLAQGNASAGGGYNIRAFGEAAFGESVFGGGDAGQDAIDGDDDEGPSEPLAYLVGHLLSEEFEGVIPDAVIDELAGLLAPRWVWRQDFDQENVQQSISIHQNLVASAQAATDALDGYEETARRLHNKPPEPLAEETLSLAEISELRRALETLRGSPVEPRSADVQAAKSAVVIIQQKQSRLQTLLDRSPELMLGALLGNIVNSLWSLLMEVVHWAYAWIIASMHFLK